MSSMNIDEFIEGVLSSMKLTQTDECPAANIEEKLVKSFSLLEQLAQRKNIELRFHCTLNPCTNRSVTVRYGLVRAEQSEILKRDGHSLQIALTVEEAADVINASPLSLSEWRLITKNMKQEPFMTLADFEQLDKLYENKA